VKGKIEARKAAPGGFAMSQLGQKRKLGDATAETRSGERTDSGTKVVLYDLGISNVKQSSDTENLGSGYSIDKWQMISTSDLCAAGK
jgi:hypothetical protein